MLTTKLGHAVLGTSAQRSSSVEASEYRRLSRGLTSSRTLLGGTRFPSPLSLRRLRPFCDTIAFNSRTFPGPFREAEVFIQESLEHLGMPVLATAERSGGRQEPVADVVVDGFGADAEDVGGVRFGQELEVCKVGHGAESLRQSPM